MKLLNFYDASDCHDERTIYEVELDDGRQIDVMRKHFPPLTNPGYLNGLWYIMEPYDKDIDEHEVLNFVKKNIPIEHVVMPVFERKAVMAFDSVKDTCYSLEQAIYLANKVWAESKPEHWEIFCIRKHSGEIIKDYKEESSENNRKIQR